MSDGSTPGHFSLRWNNFHSNLSDGFQALLQEEDLVDVTIAVEGKFVQAHKIILSICSPYFKNLFKVNPCKHPIVILQDVGYREISELLQFMYQGEVSVAQEQLPDFLKAAELLHVKGLTAAANEGHGEEKNPTKFEAVKKHTLPAKKKKLDESSTSTIKESNKEISNQCIQKVVLLGSEPRPSISSYEVVKPKEFSEVANINETYEGRSHNVQISETNRPDFKAMPRFSTNMSNYSSDINDNQGGFQMTSRGRLQLVRNGYVYHCNRQTEDKIFWKCAEYNRTRCRSRCISVGGSVTVTHASHNHTIRSNYGAPIPSPPTISSPNP